MPELDESPIPDYGKRLRVDGKVFVVFGAGNGIGRQSAHALAQLGAKIACVGRGAAATERVAQEIDGKAFLADVTKRSEVAALFEAVWRAYGRIDGIVDIVALNKPTDFDELADEDWAWQFDNVLSHAVYALQIGAPFIARSGGGSITFVGSLAGEIATSGDANYFAYGVFKAGLHHWRAWPASGSGRQRCVSIALCRD